MKRGEASITHGHKRFGKRSRVYVAWQNMKSRCENSNRRDYANYGGRGIYYSPKWILFENFLHDMGEPKSGETLDRENNDGPYYKENCRWVPYSVQALNKRDCVRHEFNGKNMTLSEWSRETGIGRVTLLKRIQRGVPLHLALTIKGHLDLSKHDVRLA